MRDLQLSHIMNSIVMDDKISGPIWTFNGAASSVSAGSGPDTQSSMTISGEEKLGETNARRKMYPKEQWLSLKPVIQRLYIDENQTFTKVAEYLDQNHGFKPTKKQFLRRISEWGFEKNVKRDERRAILGSLGVVREGEFQARKLRGRRLDKAKLERWRKREGIVGDGPQNELPDTSGESAGYIEVRWLTGSKEAMEF
jgi:Clr5 domain